MLDYQALAPSVISAASGLIGALVGGLATLRVTRAQRKEQRHSEYRERALKALDEAYQSITRFETLASMIAETATDARKQCRSWKSKEAGISPQELEGRPLTWAIRLYAPGTVDAYKIAVPALNLMMARATAAEQSSDAGRDPLLAGLVREAETARQELEKFRAGIETAAEALISPIRP